MKYYLSSGKFAYISNARDFTNPDEIRKKQNNDEDMQDLQNLGATVEFLDLKNYFREEKRLEEKLFSLDGVYISGGNTFVLRQAMKLSGFDVLLFQMSQRKDFVYIGYSAAVCVLCPTLKYYAITDDANDFPYAQIKEQIWDGLGILNFVFEPHYHSDHPESTSTDKEIQALIDDKVLFKAYKDGDVLVIE